MRAMRASLVAANLWLAAALLRAPIRPQAVFALRASPAATVAPPADAGAQPAAESSFTSLVEAWLDANRVARHTASHCTRETTLLLGEDQNVRLRLLPTSRPVR